MISPAPFRRGAAIDEDPDFKADVMADHAEDLADFAYRELCFNLDLWYGKPGQEWIHNDLQTSKIDGVTPFTCGDSFQIIRYDCHHAPEYICEHIKNCSV